MDRLILLYFGLNFQVSGVTFAFDPSKPSGQRIDPQLVQVGDEYLKMDQNYKICIKSYIYNGCDGFTMFKDAKVLVGFTSRF